MHLFTQKLIDIITKNAHRDALKLPNKTITYAELYHKAKELSKVLVLHGIEAGDRVAILGNRSELDYISILAILLTKASYVVLNPKLPLERLSYILEKSGAKGLIVDDGNLTTLNSLLKKNPNNFGNLSFYIIGGEFEAVRLSKKVLKSSSFSDGAYIMFTSGTTGAPKGVPITLDNLIAYFSSISILYPIWAEDRVINLSDLSFDLSVHEIFSAWLNGAALCVIQQVSALMAPRYVQDYIATVWISVPSVIALSTKAGMMQPYSMESIRLAFFCGEALSFHAAKQFNSACPNSTVINLWGPTEATVSFTHYKIDWNKTLPDIVPIGYPYDGQLLKLIDENGAEVKSGEKGELIQCGTQLTNGYWESPELDEGRFLTIDNTRWYRSGDVCIFNPEYGYQYLGRIDRQIKIKGYRVELQDCEAALRKASSIDLVCVVPEIELDGTVQNLIGIVCAKKINPEEISNIMSKLLPSYMVPKKIISIDNFPFNANGKIDYKALESIAGDYN